MFMIICLIYMLVNRITSTFPKIEELNIEGGNFRGKETKFLDGLLRLFSVNFSSILSQV